MTLHIVHLTCSCPNPAARARSTACARSATCSLLKMFEAWLRTVFGRSRFEAEMAEEMRLHIEARAADPETAKDEVVRKVTAHLAERGG